MELDPELRKEVYNNREAVISLFSVAKNREGLDDYKKTYQTVVKMLEAKASFDNIHLALTAVQEAIYHVYSIWMEDGLV